jgi:hypothetical protein
MGTSPPSLQVLANLLLDHKVLNAFKQRFALGHAHAEGFHCQLLPLDREHLPALLTAVRTHAHHLNAKIHARHLNRCRIKRSNRSLASCKLNRSGCNGPDSFNLRSRLWRHSSTAVCNKFQMPAGVSGLDSVNI